MGDFGPPTFHMKSDVSYGGFDTVGTIKIAPNEQDARAINKILADRYGLDAVTDRPKFRLTWSTTALEKRFGKYSLYYMKHIFLRDEVGLIEVPKYQHFQDKWVLEMLVYEPIEEIPESKHGHYESLYVFQGPNGEYLVPLFRVCELIIWKINNPERNLVEILEERDRKIFEKEVAYYENVLEDTNGSWIVTALRDREAVTVPRNYETQTYNNTGITRLK